MFLIKEITAFAYKVIMVILVDNRTAETSVKWFVIFVLLRNRGGHKGFVNIFAILHYTHSSLNLIT